MRVIACARYGPPDVLHWAEMPRPDPGPYELRVRVVATTVNSADWRVRALALPPGFGPLGRLALGLRGPRQRVLGSEFAGVVDAVGPKVRHYRPGDRVFGFPGGRMGCHAEYLCVAEDGPVALVPPGLDMDCAAALCFGGSTMLDFYRRARLQTGEHVLVNGAAGTVGTAAVQLARHQGARVTAVCSAARADALRALGADHVIDYQHTDFAQQGARYDVIVDCAGTAGPSRSLAALAPGGRLLLVLASLPDLLQAAWRGRATGRRVVAGPVSERPDDVHTLARLATEGVYRPVIDAVLPWSEFREAHARVEAGHKHGSIVLRVGPLDRMPATGHKGGFA